MPIELPALEVTAYDDGGVSVSAPVDIFDSESARSVKYTIRVRVPKVVPNYLSLQKDAIFAPYRFTVAENIEFDFDSTPSIVQKACSLASFIQSRLDERVIALSCADIFVQSLHAYLAGKAASLTTASQYLLIWLGFIRID